MKRAALFLLYLLLAVTIPSVYHARTGNKPGADNRSSPEIQNSSEAESADNNGLSLDLDNDRQIDYSIILTPPDKSLSIMPMQKNLRDYRFMSVENYRFDILRNDRAAGYFEIILHRMNADSSIYFFNLVSQDNDLAMHVEITAINSRGSLVLRDAFYENNRLAYGMPEQPESLGCLRNMGSFVDCGREGSRKYMKVGGITRFKELGNTVFDVSTSDEDGYALKNRGRDTVVLLKMHSSESIMARTEGMLSVAPLVDWPDEEACRMLSSLDLNRLKMLLPDGIYIKTPSNYVPGTPDSLYRTASALHLRESAKYVSKGQLFRNVSLSLMYSYSEAYNEDCYIPTGPKSLWLEEDFEIDGGFYDTRFNSDTAWSLMAIYDKYRDDWVMGKVRNYIGFYMDFSQTFAFKTHPGTFFVPDYMDSSRINRTTHCSLNHLLAEMCVLYRYYYLTGDSRTLAMAHSIRDSIEATSREWVKDDGDLWYAVTPSGEYIKGDYPLLTYYDLNTAAELMKQVGESVPEGIAYMIERKGNWAKSKGYL